MLDYHWNHVFGYDLCKLPEDLDADPWDDPDPMTSNEEWYDEYLEGLLAYPLWDELAAVREQDALYFAWACESWHERYAEAGSNWVFSGCNPQDAHLAAYMAVGPYPQPEDFDLTTLDVI